MKGMYFVEVIDNRPVAQGRVGPQINPDYVFVQYDQPRKYARTVNMVVFSSFALFKTVEEMTAFIAPPKIDVPAGTPTENSSAPAVDGANESSAD